MSDKSTGLNLPSNDGDFSKIYINFEKQTKEIGELLYVSILDDELVFKKTSGLVFSLIQNDDILSIVPRVELKINKKTVQPGSMYILDTKDIIVLNDKEFSLHVEIPVKEERIEKAIKLEDEDINLENNFPPDITQEIEISSFKSKMITPDLPKDQKKSNALFSFFKRFKKTSKTEVKPQAFEFKSNKAISPSSANALIRVIAIALDLLLSATVLEFITIDKEILDIVNQVGLDFSKFHLELNTVYYIFSLVLVFYALRVISSFILGVSIGQVLCGIYVDDGVLSKRIKALFRETIGLITGPLILFDLPSLMAKRTLKEVLSASRIQSSGIIKTFIFSLVSLSVLFSIWITAPIFSTEANLNKVDVDVTVLAKKMVTKDLEVQKSKFFKFALDSNLTVLPEYSFKRIGSKVIGQPKLNIYSQSGKSQIAFVKKIDLRKVLENLKHNNFIIKEFYPHLSEVIFDKRENSLSVQAIKEILEATDVSYSLNLETIPGHLLSKGPFISSYLNYRIQLDQVIATSFSSISYQNIANYPFLKFEKTKRSSRYLALSLGAARILDISSKDKRFVRSILPLGQNTKVTSSLLDLVDRLYGKDFSEKSLKDSFGISFEFLKKAMNKEFNITKKDILKSFDSQLKYLATIKRTIKEDETKTLMDMYVQNISDLTRAYKDDERSYFFKDEVTPEATLVDPELIIPDDVNNKDLIEEIDNE